MTNVGTSPGANVAMDGDPDLVARLGRAWRQIRRGSATSAVRDRIYGIGSRSLEPGQMDALDLLVAADSCRMGELAIALGVDPSTATRAVQRLVKAGLVEHLSHDGDARVVHIGITATGRTLHAEVAERRREVLSSVLDEFSPDERPRLADYMERFARAIDSSSKKKRWQKK